jgi:hypothetical protein
MVPLRFWNTDQAGAGRSVKHPRSIEANGFRRGSTRLTLLRQRMFRRSGRRFADKNMRK